MRNWLPLHGYQSYQRIQRTGLFRASPPVILAAGFLGLILMGTLLLSLPMASRNGISATNAFFMATSAVTVTGLTSVEPAIAFTHFGQIVLMTLVQLGGLGFVTFAVVSAIMLGKKMSLTHQALALEALNQTSVSKIQKTAFSVFKLSITIELIMATILTLWWWRDYPLITAIYRAIFHAITSFNNAGFSLFPNSLNQFLGDPVTVLVITASIILGGIGFSVLGDISQKKRWSSLLTYTKVIIMGTLALNLTGFVVIWALEFNNPHTLANLPWHSQALAAWMQSVTSRTAGFVTLDITQLHDSSTLIIMLLMFIGGGSLSTASGIKIGTFIILLAAVYSYIRHRKEVVLFKRSVSSDTIQKSLALLLANSALIFLGVLILTTLEELPFISILFEVVSAVSTTGMSRDLTPQLSTASQLVLTLLMFAGRLGPLTLIYSLATQQRSRVRYPETEFQVG
ncbi:TrkH family potassium uptake protein [Pollutimonas harenae]|uniref:Potassium transporter n=1 Tax=Pollutimonas harenae TaxID=657015 RepID=A0A853H5X6_9BURK|nr:TrkH family potassium uptake protein [Pollutimonas harenae]NYT85933.1 potassium transporter [Pollutimonas harenae]TEA70985.1 potassium transporter [Pollutimonas harenae]